MEILQYNEIDMSKPKSFHVVGELSSDCSEMMEGFETFLNKRVDINEITDAENAEVVIAALLEFFRENDIDIGEDDDADSDMFLPATVSAVVLCKDKSRKFAIVSLMDLTETDDLGEAEETWE